MPPSEASVTLPEGWTKHESKSRPGTYYYYAQSTGERTWDLPTEPAAAQAVESVDGQELALARQIVDRAYPEDRREAVFFATMDELTAQMRSSIMPSERRGNRGCS